MSTTNSNDQSISATKEASEHIAVGAGIDFSDPNSPLAPYYMTISQMISVGVLAVLFVLLNFVPLWHTDIWGHLKFGEWIAQNGSLPEGNPFNKFLEQEVASNHYSWLTQSLFYSVYHAGEMLAGGDAQRQMRGGVDALRFTHAVLVVLRLIVLLLVFRQISNSWPLSLLSLSLLILVSAGSMAVLRPQVVGEVCFASLLFALTRPQLTVRVLIGIPVLLILWANLHGSYVVGLLLLGVFLIGKLLETGRRLSSWNPKSIFGEAGNARLALVLLLCIVGIGIANPAGPWIYSRTLLMVHHPVVRMMDEWRPLSFNWGAGGHWVYLGIAAVIAGSIVYARRLPRITSILLIVIFGLQPLLQQRAFVWWLMLFPFVVLPLWCAQGNPEKKRLIGWRSTPSFRKTLVAAMVVVVAMLWSIPGQWIMSGAPSPLERSLSQGTPWQLVQQLQGEKETDFIPGLQNWLRRHYDEGRFRGTIFASETLGDYFLWSMGEKSPVFIYSHVHLIPKQHWDKVAEVRFARDNWRSVLDEHKVNLVAVEAELNLRLRTELYKSDDWAVVYDEAGKTDKRDHRCRLLIAVRREPTR